MGDNGVSELGAQRSHRYVLHLRPWQLVSARSKLSVVRNTTLSEIRILIVASLLEIPGKLLTAHAQDLAIDRLYSLDGDGLSRILA